MQNKCNALESSPNHPPNTPAPRSVEKLSSMKLVPGAKPDGDRYRTIYLRVAGRVDLECSQHKKEMVIM